MEASSSASAAALAEGKTKLILPTSDPRQVLVLSKDSITAGNGLKVPCPPPSTDLILHPDLLRTPICCQTQPNTPNRLKIAVYRN